MKVEYQRILDRHEKTEQYLKERGMRREYVYVLLFLLHGSQKTGPILDHIEKKTGKRLSYQLWERWYRDLYAKKFIKKHPSKKGPSNTFTLYPKGVDFLKEFETHLIETYESR